MVNQNLAWSCGICTIELFKIYQGVTILSRDGTKHSIIEYRLNIPPSSNLLNVLYVNNHDSKWILSDYMLVHLLKKRKKNADLDARLKTVTMSYDVNDIADYLSRIAMNLKIKTGIFLNKFYFKLLQ